MTTRTAAAVGNFAAVRDRIVRPINQRRGGFIEVIEAKGFNAPERTLYLDVTRIESITDITGSSRGGLTLIGMASGAKHRVNHRPRDVLTASAWSRFYLERGEVLHDESDYE